MLTERTYKAIVIGNSTYTADAGELPKLLGPVSDAKAVTSALTHEQWGMHHPENVRTIIDGSKGEIEQALEDLFTDATASDQILVYFSGHGIHEIYDRLFLCTTDTVAARPVSTAIPMSTVVSLAETTNAAATVIMLDCCFSGILKGRDPALAAEGRGRWLIGCSRRNQRAMDAANDGDLSPFSALVATGLVANKELDSNEDGFVTVSDLTSFIAPRLEEQTGQVITYRFDGSGDLAIALAPNHPHEFTPDWNNAKKALGVPVPPVPSSTQDRDRLLDETLTRGATAPTLSDLNFSMNENEFSNRLVELLRTNDLIPLQLALKSSRKETRRLLENDDGWTTLAPLLDRLATMTATFINMENEEWSNKSVAILSQLYEFGFDDRGLPRASSRAAGGINSDEFWYALIQRVFALGALAVREKSWVLVKTLSSQRPNGHDFRHYNNWIRHALVQAARANLMRRERDGRFVDLSIIQIVAELISVHETFAPDVSASQTDIILDSLCQFDALSCVSALVTAYNEHDEDDETSSCYPSFAKFDTERTTPAFELLINDSAARDVIAPVDNKVLARIFSRLDSYAKGESRTMSGWWGIRATPIADFVLANQ